jgi:hypothetical protein
MTVIFKSSCASAADFTTQGGSSPSPAVSFTHPRTGARAILLDTSSGAQQTLLVKTVTLADAGRRISYGLYFSALPTALCTHLSCRTAGDLAVVSLRLQTSGVLEMWHASARIGAAGATVLAVNTPYRIALAYTVTSTSSWAAKAYINGVEELSRTNADATLSNAVSSRMTLGWGNASVGADRQMWIDDVYVDDGADLADPGDTRQQEPGSLLLLGAGA